MLAVTTKEDKGNRVLTINIAAKAILCAIHYELTRWIVCFLKVGEVHR